MAEQTNSEPKETYLELLEFELYKKYPGKKQSELATLIGFGVSTLHKIFKDKNKIGTDSTISEIADKVHFISFEKFQHRKPLLDKIKKRLLEDDGYWASYCFNKRRRLYESIWKFTEKERVYDSDGKTETFIEVIRDTVDHQYIGELSINMDMTLSISASTSDNYHNTSITKFTDNMDEEFYDSFEHLVFDVQASRPKDFFTSLEVLVKPDQKTTIKPKMIEYTNINPEFDKSFNPTNKAYLAFNYLTRNVSKCRRKIDNSKINQITKTGGRFTYTHDIFIACPVGYLKNQEQFIKLKNTVLKIIDELKELGFLEENIHCALPQYQDYKEIGEDNRHNFFESRKHIGSTHFLALIPEDLAGYHSKIYLEIDYRVLKKLPAFIFVENAKSMPSILKELRDSPDKPINVTFKDIDLENVHTFLKSRKDEVFQFTL